MTVPIHIYSNLEKNGAIYKRMEHDCTHPYLQQFRKEWSMTVSIHIYSNLEENGA